MKLLRYILSWFKPKPPVVVVPPPPPKVVPPPKPAFVRPVVCPQNGKVSRTESEARQTAKRKKLRAYKCEFCPAWHLTHQRNRMTLH